MAIDELKAVWDPMDKPAKRRQAALSVACGDYKAASELLLLLARVRQNRTVKWLARADAAYFYKKHKRLVDSGVVA